MFYLAPMGMRLYYALLSLSPLLIVPVLSQTCYFPNGSEAPNTYPCTNTDTGHSSCCEIGDICWSNGVCQKVKDGITDWIRQGCTDYTWKDPSCPAICLKFPTNAVGVRPCNGISGPNYCCDFTPSDPGNLACCQTTTNIFVYKSATVLATIQVRGASIAMGANALASSTSTSVTPAKSPDAPVDSVRITDATPTATPKSPSKTETTTTTSTSTGSGSTRSSADSGASTKDDSSGLPMGVKIGIGVGVAVGGLISLSGVVFLLLRNRNRKKPSQSASPAYAMVPPPNRNNLKAELDGGAVAPQSIVSYYTKMELDGTGILSPNGLQKKHTHIDPRMISRPIAYEPEDSKQLRRGRTFPQTGERRDYVSRSMISGPVLRGDECNGLRSPGLRNSYQPNTNRSQVVPLEGQSEGLDSVEENNDIYELMGTEIQMPDPTPAEITTLAEVGTIPGAKKSPSARRSEMVLPDAESRSGPKPPPQDVRWSEIVSPLEVGLVPPVVRLPPDRKSTVGVKKSEAVSPPDTGPAAGLKPSLQDVRWSEMVSPLDGSLITGVIRTSGEGKSSPKARRSEIASPPEPGSRPGSVKSPSKTSPKTRRLEVVPPSEARTISVPAEPGENKAQPDVEQGAWNASNNKGSR